MSGLFGELRRRNVFRVAIAYVALAWLIIQVADIVFENIGTPDWVMKTLMFLLAIGFPLAFLFAWAYEVTPEGIKREKDVDRSQSITHETGRKLNRMIIAVLIVAVGFLLVDKFMLREPGTEISATATAATEKSVAVLPFVAMSSGEDDEYFADGLTEEILNSLTRLPELLVTARTSAFHFKGRDIPIPEIASQLGVAHVVEGSVRRDGDRLRVTAQLIRAEDGFHLWSANYDRETEDTFGVQTDIAKKIAIALDVYLDDEALARMRASGFRNPEAYVAYQRGFELYNEAHSDWDLLPGLREANQWFDRVIALEPNSTKTYLLHADYYTHLLRDAYETVSPEDVENAREHMHADLDEAVRTAADEVSRLSAEFDRAFVSGNWRHLRKIAEAYLDVVACPTSGWVNTALMELGRAEEVTTVTLKQVACDPRNMFGWRDSINALIWSGNPDEAVRIGEEAMTAIPTQFVELALVHAYVAAGRIEDAEALIGDSMQGDEFLNQARTFVAAAVGDAEEAGRLMEAVQAEYSDRKDIHLAYLPQTGDRERANRLAAEIDRLPYGYMTLAGVPAICMCGAPWDIEATPNFARKIAEAGAPWPPASPINWPLKDW